MTFGLLAAAVVEEGASNPAGSYVVWGLVLALVAFAVAYFLVGPGRGNRGEKRLGDIPLAMRPYHSDEELETTALERAMSWGVALSMFAAIFLPLYWLVEPARINDKMDEFYEEETAFGRGLFVSNCATCHGTNAEGGAAPNPYSDAPWPAPRLNNIAARYADSEIVTDIREFVATTLFQGRPGTPMPAWGTAYQGPMNDQQIYAITDYLLSIQIDEVPEVEAQAFVGASGEDLYGNNCARCHGQELQGIVGPNLWNIYERYGSDGDDPEAQAEVRDLILGTLQNGRYIPTGAIMPSFANDLPEDAMQSIIDYIESQQRLGGPPYGQIGGYPGTGGPNDGSVDTDGEE